LWLNHDLAVYQIDLGLVGIVEVVLLVKITPTWTLKRQTSGPGAVVGQ
jgi:hypothetical protein